MRHSVLLAFDDTDSPRGGCTTALVQPVVEALGGPSVLDGLPRLVRLDPSCRWKTRGNAAVVIPLRDELAPTTVLERAHTVIAREAHLSPNKGAGIAVFERAPDVTWYWRGVQGPVTREELAPVLDEAHTASLGNGRGLIGAACAAAWRPDEVTYEHIAYRELARWGTAREVDAGSLARVQRDFEETFDCVDGKGRPVMVPHTPCPVLYGLRATEARRLDEAAARIEGERVAWRTLFVTNHASDDHVRDACLTWLTLDARPQALRGGHVRAVGTSDAGERRTMMAFEPTGALRHAVLAMQPGDRVLPVGSLRDDTVHLEKVLHVPGPRRVRTPCPSCGRAMRSAGRDAPLRCRACGRRREARTRVADEQWYEADASARRHLARPLSLGLAPRVARAAEPVTMAWA